MATMIMLCLAVALIFWRPPFRLPHISRKLLIPIILILIFSSLLIIGTMRSTSNNSQSQQTTKPTQSTEPVVRQSNLSF